MTQRKAKCPKCGGHSIKVVDTMPSRDGMAIFRKRECGDCNAWINTEERLENHGRNVHEDRLVDIYRKLNHNKRKALWAVLKFM